MNVYGQLIKAALEVSASDLSGTITGLSWWNSTSGQVKVSDGTTVRAMLRNDQKAIIGNNGTANNNVRFHRGANEVLQFVVGGDATAEGSLSTALAQVSGRVENYATGSLPAAANAGRLLYDTTVGFVKFDTGAAIKTLVSTDGVQTITGKELTGGTASDSLRWRLPSETTTNLAGLSNLSGLIAYDTTQNKVVFNNGSGWSLISTGGSAAFSVTSKTANYTAVAGEYIKVDATGGTFTITLPTAAGVTGQTIVIDRTDNTLANNVLIDTTSSQTIDGALTKHCYTGGEKWTLVSDGSNWRVQEHLSDTPWSTSTISIISNGGTNPTKPTVLVHDKFSWRRKGSMVFFKMLYAQTSATGAANGTQNYIITTPTGITFKTSTDQIADTTMTAGRPNTSSLMGTGDQYSAADSTSGVHAIHLYDSTHLAVWFQHGTGQWWGTNTATSSYSLNSGNELRIMSSGMGIHANWED